jgi:hypothetical protein
MAMTSNSGNATASYPIARGFAFIVLLALGALIVMRHLFGSVRVEGGVR